MGTYIPQRLDLERYEVEWTEKELTQAFDRVRRDSATSPDPIYPMEVMTWSRHEEIWGEHRTLLKPSEDCERFVEILHELQSRVPTDEELDWLMSHEEGCESEFHSDSALEKLLGLPNRAFSSGAPEYGLLPPKVFADHIRSELHRRATRKRLRIALEPADRPGTEEVSRGARAPSINK